MNRPALAALLSLGTTLAVAAESGVLETNFDSSVRPQDDFYLHVNGRWLKDTPIPADKSSYGVFAELADQAQAQLRTIIEQAAADPGPPGSDRQKIGDMYRSFLDSERVEALGLQPLDAELLAIELLDRHEQIPGMVARHFRLGADTLIGGWVGRDPKQPDEYIVSLYHAGLGMPDRDYYLKDEERFVTARKAYVDYVTTVLRTAGTPGAASVARELLALETRLARLHWPRVERRDAEKTYNRFLLSELDGGEFDLRALMRQIGVPADGAVILREADFFTRLGEVVNQTEIALWREYFRFQLIDSFAPYLQQSLVDAHFAFHGRAISGTQQLKPRWKRGVDTVENTLGEVLGRLYVERHFPPASKQRMERMVAQLIAAYDRSIRRLDWMGPATKDAALTKLSKFRAKIGYPDRWKDYSALVVDAGDLLGNVLRSNQVEYARELAKLGQPIDHGEWLMTPQTINAYFLPTANEIVFPAAILQPPFFNVAADDAVNYGAIGSVIGHEIGHGFDDQGSRYDGDGRLRNWWTAEDRERFEARTEMLVEQYGAYSPVPGHSLNGKLTLGENIGDLGGVSIAFSAYKHSLGGKPAPVIDGLTGNQRFFIGWAQAWRWKYRRDELLRKLTTDVHAPGHFRTNGVLSNLPVFYETFDIEAGDGMYRPPEKRVRIW